MKRAGGLVLAVIVLGLMAVSAARGAPSPVDAGPPRAGDWVLVELAGGALPSGLTGQRLEPVFDDWYRLYLSPGAAVDATLSAVAALPGVARVSPDYVVQVDALRRTPAQFAPDDPLYGRQWHMPQVQADEAWDAADGAGVIVAVLDTGVATAGADGFCAPLAAEYSALTGRSGPGEAIDRYDHGTHVAGTVAGCTANGVGVTGIAYGARIMAVKVLNDSGSGFTSDIAEGIVWAADNGAGVINMSLGSKCTTNWPSCSTAIVNDALDYAAAADVVIVASAGNSNVAYVGQPGNHPEVIAVSATDYRRARASYSSYGAAVDLAAPGGDSTVDLNNDGFGDGVLQETFNRSTGVWDYYYKSGTSMAAPHVAGAAALLRSCAPEATRDEVRAALESSALDLGAAGRDNVYGSGFLQIHDALATLAAQFGRDAGARCDFLGGETPCLTVAAAASPGGRVSIAPDPDCDAAGAPGYSFGTVLTITPTPDADYYFDRWSGGAAGSADPLVKTIYRDLNLTAEFRSCLRVAATDDGRGHVTVSPAPNCGASGYSGGTVLTATAVPDAGYFFDQWGGDGSGTANPLTVTLNANLNLSAAFAACFAVTTHADGPGSVNVAPSPNCAGGADYNGRTTVTLTAVPDPDHSFSGWSGGASGATNPLALTLSGNLDVTARFVARPRLAISLFADGPVAGFGPARDEDVLFQTPAGWSLLFDGSANRLPGDVNALARLDDGTLLLSPDAPVKNLPGIGATAVDDSDIVRFDPATGLYSWYFDGSDAGLTLAGEDVDAIALLPDGRLLISTVGAAKVPGVTAADEDVLVFSGALGSASTPGTWALYIDGSDLAGGLGDIDAIAVFQDVVYLSSDANVTIGGQVMARGDVFACAGLTPGPTTRCAGVSRAWQGSANGLAATANVDALELVSSP